MGVPPRSLAARRGHALLGGGSPLRPPTWRPHALSARNCLGGLRPSSLDPRMTDVRSACLRVSSPSSVSFLSCPAVPPVASWLYLLPRSPASSGSTAVPIGASKPYLRCGSATCLVLAPSVPEVCLVGVPALPLYSAVTRCGRGGAAVLGPPIRSSLLPPDSCAPVARVVGGFSSPPHPWPSSLALPHLWWSLRWFRHPGATLTLRGCRCPMATRLPLLLHVRTPRGFFRHTVGLAAPVLVPHSRGLVGHSRGLAEPVFALHS